MSHFLLLIFASKFLLSYCDSTLFDFLNKMQKPYLAKFLRDSCLSHSYAAFWEITYAFNSARLMLVPTS